MPRPLHKLLLLVLVFSQAAEPLMASDYALLSPPRTQAQPDTSSCLFRFQALGRSLEWTRNDLFQEPIHRYQIRRELSAERLRNPFSGPGGDSAIGHPDELVIRGKRHLAQERPARALKLFTRARIHYRQMLKGLSLDSELTPIASQHLAETEALIQEAQQLIRRFLPPTHIRIPRELAEAFVLAQAVRLHPTTEDEVREWKMKRTINSKARRSQTLYPSFRELVQGATGTSSLQTWRRVATEAKEDTADLADVLSAESAAHAAVNVVLENQAAALRFPQEWANAVAAIKSHHGGFKRWAEEIGTPYIPFLNFLRTTPRDSELWETAMKSTRITEQYPALVETYAKKEKLDDSVRGAIALLRELGWRWIDVSRAYFDIPDLRPQDAKAKRMYNYFSEKTRLPIPDIGKLIRIIQKLSAKRSPNRLKAEFNLELHELKLTMGRTGSKWTELEEALHKATGISLATVRLGIMRKKSDVKNRHGMISIKKRAELFDAARVIQKQRQHLLTMGHKRLFIEAMAGAEGIVRVAPVLNLGVPLSEVLAAFAGQLRPPTAEPPIEEIHEPPVVMSSESPDKLRLLENISRCQAQIAGLLPNELLQHSLELRRQRMKHEPLSETEAINGIALYSEAAARTPGIGQPTREQWLAALSMLLDGPVAVEQQTGEGKTISIAAAAYVMSLEGLGVQVHTFNRYLARRDAKWMEKVYQKLGCSVGVLDADGADDYVQHRGAHRKDITYGDADDFISDYLRDELEISADRQRQRSNLPTAVFLDEADPRLLDEAEDPVILSSPSGQRLPAKYLMEMYEFGGTLTNETDFVPGQAYLPAQLTEAGKVKVLAVAFKKRWSIQEEDLIDHAQDALAARYFCERNVDYVVLGDRIHLINETTHRLKEGAVWEGQLNNFIALKEKQRGNLIPLMSTPLAHNLITRQDYYAMRNGRLRAISGTLREATEELWRIYHLRTVLIPRTNAPTRVDAPFRLFLTEAQKRKAVEIQVQASHRLNWPVLTISPSIGAAQYFTDTLRPSIPEARRLSVFEEAEEARILAGAGLPGAETNATLMAGRGTDIRGRLVVIGTSPPSNRRGERQIRGRAGRWTDPGESFLFGSLDDSLFKDNLSSEAIEQLRLKANEAGEVPEEVAQGALDKAREVAEGLRQSLRLATRDRGNLLTAHRERFFQQIASHTKSRAAMLELNALWLEYLSEIRVLRRRLPLRDYIAQTSKLYDDTVHRAESIVSVELAQERERAAILRRFEATLPRLMALIEQGWQQDEMALATATENFPAPLSVATIRALLSNKLPDNMGILDQLEASLPAMEAPDGLTTFRKKRIEDEQRLKHESNLRRLVEIQTRLRTLVKNDWSVVEIGKKTATKQHPQKLSWQLVNKVLNGDLPNEFVLTQLEVALPILADQQSPSAILKAQRIALAQRANAVRSGIQDYIRQGWIIDDISAFTATQEDPMRCSGTYITRFLAGAPLNDLVMLDKLEATLRRMHGIEPPSIVRERLELAYKQKISNVRSRILSLIENGWTVHALGQHIPHSYKLDYMYKMIRILLGGIFPHNPSIIDALESGLPIVESWESPKKRLEMERQSKLQLASSLAARLRTLVDRGWRLSEIAQACVTERFPTPIPVAKLAWIARGNAPSDMALLTQLAECLPDFEQRISPAQVRAEQSREQRHENTEGMTARPSHSLSRRTATMANTQERARLAEAREAVITAAALERAKRVEADRAVKTRLAARASSLRDQIVNLNMEGWTNPEIVAYTVNTEINFAQMTSIIGHLLRGHVPSFPKGMDTLEQALPPLHHQKSPSQKMKEERQEIRQLSEQKRNNLLVLKAARKLQREERERVETEARKRLELRTVPVRAALQALVDRGWSIPEIAKATVTGTFQKPIHAHSIFWILEGFLPNGPKLDQLEAALLLLKGQDSPSHIQAITRASDAKRLAEQQASAIKAIELFRNRTAAVRAQLQALRDRGWRPIEIGCEAVTKILRQPIHSRTIVWILRGSTPGDPTVIDQLEATLPSLKDRKPPSQTAKQEHESGQFVLGLRKRTQALRLALNKLAKKGWTPGDIGILAKSNKYRRALQHMTVYHIMAGHLPRDPKTLDQLEAAMPKLNQLQSRERSLKAAAEYFITGRIPKDPLIELFFRRQISDTRRKTFLKRAS